MSPKPLSINENSSWNFSVNPAVGGFISNPFMFHSDFSDSLKWGVVVVRVPDKASGQMDFRRLGRSCIVGSQLQLQIEDMSDINTWLDEGTATDRV